MPNDMNPNLLRDEISKSLGEDYAGFYETQIQGLVRCINYLTEYVVDQTIKSEIEEVLSIYELK